ncbi:hypothetical protein FHS29_004722 [Saccharothrix tamanrassetensis]|uniref:Secreted protein n=1 Tax=Saccharothrix tamanrassetensis TaxID=1051531 RepID=A0A841CP23_9PSEU|nr:hypothetical protein [Saccharothrix tamanrassetensis]MBB5958114.1 hypothetical protein [Saccharothrix tamanrassetensis]
MFRTVRNAVIAGAVAMGALLFAGAPASAAPVAESGGKVVVVPATEDGRVSALAAGCRYAGWFQFSDGRVVHIYVCE